MNYKIEIEGELSRPFFAKSAEIGDVMEVIDNIHNGEILLCTSDGFVSLNKPKNTWDTTCSLKVRLFPKGTIIKLII